MSRIEILKETLQSLKKGGGIHIKKENRGKFTSYCGGKVTSECIARGKNSPNPAIRKRATFAANARKWKHQYGGVLQAEYEKSLDDFIRNNPKIYGLNTSYFRDFLIELVRRESSFNPNAKQGSYYGWYQTKIPVGTDTSTQHNLAFKHLSGLFNNTISKADVQKARNLGIGDAPLLLKYWNQGNRVNNYIWNDKDSLDGLKTKISEYGNDIVTPLDIYNYAMDNLNGEYVVQSGDNWFDLQKKVRMNGRDYSAAGKDLWNMQKIKNKYGILSIGQKLNFGETPKSIEVTKQFSWDPENRLSLSYKYQNGGNLVYHPFIPKESSSKNTTNAKEDIVGIDQYRFPVEPVKIHKLQKIEWYPNEVAHVENQAEDKIENLAVSNANSNNLNEINKQLKNAGYRKTQRAAILATVIAESGANPAAIGDAGKAKGLFQWHPNRFNAGIDLDSQIKLMLSELSNYSNPNGWSESAKYNKQNAFDTFVSTDDLFSAVSALTANFIRPRYTDNEIRKRYRIAQELLKQMTT